MEIAADIHRVCQTFPKTEVYGLVSQMNRCSISMPSNIAEGSSRGNKQFRYFLDISLGSSYELQTQLLIAFQNGYIKEETVITIENKIIEFQRMISGFISKLDY